MNPQEWYMSILLRLDRIQSVLNALKAFYAAQTEHEAVLALSKVHQLAQIP